MSEIRAKIQDLSSYICLVRLQIIVPSLKCKSSLELQEAARKSAISISVVDLREFIRRFKQTMVVSEALKLECHYKAGFRQLV